MFGCGAKRGKEQCQWTAMLMDESRIITEQKASSDRGLSAARWSAARRVQPVTQHRLPTLRETQGEGPFGAGAELGGEGLCALFLGEQFADPEAVAVSQRFRNRHSWTQAAGEGQGAAGAQKDARASGGEGPAQPGREGAPAGCGKGGCARARVCARMRVCACMQPRLALRPAPPCEEAGP